MPSYTLEIYNLSMHYATQDKPFFSDVSFGLPTGGLHRLHGKNGMGKSTLFHVLRGTLNKAVQLKGQVVMHGQSYACQDIRGSFLFQNEIVLMAQQVNHMLADSFTFTQHLSFAQLPNYPALYKSLTKSPILPDFLKDFHINPDLPVHLLSGGQRQILGLCMLLCKKPSILLLDEPTAALDPKNSAMVMECLTQLVQKGLTVWVITHDADLAQRYCTGYTFEIIPKPDGSRTLVQC